MGVLSKTAVGTQRVKFHNRCPSHVCLDWTVTVSLRFSTNCTAIGMDGCTKSAIHFIALMLLANVAVVF